MAYIVYPPLFRNSENSLFCLNFHNFLQLQNPQYQSNQSKMIGMYCLYIYLDKTCLIGLKILWQCQTSSCWFHLVFTKCFGRICDPPHVQGLKISKCAEKHVLLLFRHNQCLLFCFYIDGAYGRPVYMRGVPNSPKTLCKDKLKPAAPSLAFSQNLQAYKTCFV